MCRFGCIFQLTCDNGMEFKGAVDELTWKYKVPVIRISPYNSQANGKIERTQQAYLEVIWKVLQGEMNQWPLWLGYALWADQIMVKKNTGYSPYYLLYGQHPLLLFDVTDCYAQHWKGSGCGMGQSVALEKLADDEEEAQCMLQALRLPWS